MPMPNLSLALVARYPGGQTAGAEGTAHVDIDTKADLQRPKLSDKEALAS